ncbi:MAG: V-type ATP synthase subunit F [Planctomycetota bacterium]
MEGKVAVLGDADFVMPFSAMGLDTFTADDAGLQETAQKIISSGYALVIVAENIAGQLEEAFAPVQNKAVPCIIVVPFTQEPEGFAVRALGSMLKMATGIDILAN